MNLALTSAIISSVVKFELSKEEVLKQKKKNQKDLKENLGIKFSEELIQIVGFLDNLVVYNICKILKKYHIQLPKEIKDCIESLQRKESVEINVIKIIDCSTSFLLSKIQIEYFSEIINNVFPKIGKDQNLSSNKGQITIKYSELLELEKLLLKKYLFTKICLENKHKDLNLRKEILETLNMHKEIIQMLMNETREISQDLTSIYENFKNYKESFQDKTIAEAKILNEKIDIASIEYEMFYV